MLIGVDLDDVLADTSFALDQYYNKKFGTSFKRDDHYTFNLAELWNVTPNECQERVLAFHKSSNFDAIKPIPGSKRALEKLLKDHEIKIITSRLERFKDKTISWLKKHYPFHQFDIHFTNYYFGLNDHKKSHICKNFNVDLLIDDSLEYALECTTESDVNVLLLDSPWNQTKKLPQKIKRVSNWDNVLSEIESPTP